VNSVPSGGRCYSNSVLFSYTVCGKVDVCKKMQILSEKKMRAEWEIKYLFLRVCFGSFLTYNLMCANAPGLCRSLLDTDQISWSPVRVTKSPRQYEGKPILQSAFLKHILAISWCFCWDMFGYNLWYIFVVELVVLYSEQLFLHHQKGKLWWSLVFRLF